MSDSESKTDPASSRKLKKQREEGSLAQSTEGGAFLATAALILVMFMGFSHAISLIRSNFRATFISMELPFDAAVNTAARQVTLNTVMIILPVALTMVVIALVVALIYNKGPTFAVKPVTLQFNRVSPKAGIKRVYGRRGWIETATAVVRISLWFGAVTIVGIYFGPSIFMVVRCGFGCVTELVWMILVIVGVIAALIFLIFAAVDMIVQKSLFLHEQQMTKSEVQREKKEQHGSPEVRQERRRRMRESAKGADSVGANRANMCFYGQNQAIAVRYHPELAPLPRIAVLARTPEQVATLRKKVRKNGFPELNNEALVAACMTSLPGEPVPENAFDELAAAMSQIFARKT